MKKKRVLQAILMLLSCLLLMQGCIQISDPNQDDTSTRKEQPAMPPSDSNYHDSAIYTYSSDVEVAFLLTELSQEYLLLANKSYVLGDSYAPSSLSTLTRNTNGGKHVELESRVARALCEMLDEMESEGVTDIAVTSGYRSYSYQQSLYNYYLGEERKGISVDAYNHFGADYLQEHYHSKGITKLTEADAKAVVLSYSAYPGTSEHQTGLCLDFVTSTAGLTTAFENTDAFAWLSENAYKFGFILRYPKGKEDITGYTYEPWHYRFVGREAATDIFFGKLTLEEYLGATEK